MDNLQVKLTKGLPVIYPLILPIFYLLALFEYSRYYDRITQFLFAHKNISLEFTQLYFSMDIINLAAFFLLLITFFGLIFVYYNLFIGKKDIIKETMRLILIQAFLCVIIHYAYIWSINLINIYYNNLNMPFGV